MSFEQPPGQWPHQPQSGQYPTQPYPPQQYAPLPPPAKVRKGHKRWIIPTCTAIAGIILGSASAGGSGQPTASAETTTVTETATITAHPAAAQPSKAPASQAPQAAAAITDDGTYEVGTDIKPGTYKAPGAQDDLCYWARLKTTDGGIDSIIANNVGGHRQIVTIKRTDKAFETRDCGSWVRVR